MRTKQATAQLPVGNLTNLANTYRQALASTFNLIYDGSNSCIPLSLKAVRIMSNGAGANAASVKGRRSLCSRDKKLLFTVCVCTLLSIEASQTGLHRYDKLLSRFHCSAIKEKQVRCTNPTTGQALQPATRHTRQFEHPLKTIILLWDLWDMHRKRMKMRRTL